VNNDLFDGLAKHSAMWAEFEFAHRHAESALLLLAMPTSSKRACLLEDVTDLHLQHKQAWFEHNSSKILNDLPSSDTQSDVDTSSLMSLISSISSISLVSSISSISSISSLSSASSSLATHLEYSFGDSNGVDTNSLKDKLFEWWDAWIRVLTIEILTVRVLEMGPPVKKFGQLDLYLIDFRYNHPDRFRKRLRVSPLVFNHLMDLIENHPVFHNNSNVPQLPIPIQLAILLVCVGHYGNASSPEYVAQWAGISVGSVVNMTYRCLATFLALHDDAVMILPEDEKERMKEYVEMATCPEWWNGFLLADGTKFPLFQKPGLHGEAWFDKNKDYSLDCQVCARCFRVSNSHLPFSRSSACPRTS